MGKGGHQIHTLSPKSAQYEGHITKYVIVACIVGAFGGLIFGYDIGISGGVTSMDEFLLKFFPSVYEKKHTAITTDYCKYDNQYLQLFTSSLYIAGLFAAFPASYITRTYGRTKTMLYGGISFLIGAALNGFAQNLAMLVIGRIFLGVGVGFATQSVPLYLSEMAPPRQRGALNILFQFAITVGILVANIINWLTASHPHGWRYSLGLAAVPAIMLISGSLGLPDTPNSLIERGQKEKGKEILQRIRGVQNVDVEYDEIVESSDLANQIKHPWSNLMKRKYMPQLVLAILIPFLQQLTGINVIMFYAPVLFNTIGFGANATLYSAVIIGAVNIGATIVSIIAVDRFGRRALLFEGGIQMIMSQIAVAVILGTSFGGTKILSKGLANLVLFFVSTFIAAFAWSWGPLGWLVPSEIFPMEIRSAGQAIVVSVNLAMTFVIAQAFLSILCHFQYGSFLFFAVWEVAMTLFVFFFVPETKNVPIEEVVHIWRNHWFWKRIVPEEDVIAHAI